MEVGALGMGSLGISAHWASLERCLMHSRDLRTWVAGYKGGGTPLPPEVLFTLLHFCWYLVTYWFTQAMS